MELPKITKQQHHMLYLLYKFRFISTNQFQKLLNHKYSTRTQTWLKDLKDKGYVQTTFERKSYKDWSQPFVYHITPLARHILKKNEDCDLRVLSRVYKEKKRTKSFIRKCLAVVTLYLYFLSNKNENQELLFLTETEVLPHEYFPEKRPTAYIALRTGEETQRYFLEWFDKYTVPGGFRAVFYKYIKYADSGSWEAHAQGIELPAVLFVCPTQNGKKHIIYHAKAIFEKEFEDKIQFFVTTRGMLNGNTKNVWEKVSYL